MPKRLVLVYGESNLCYAFCGTSILAENWIPLLLELRDLVEKFAVFSFNYVSLNLYTDDFSYIFQHENDESGFDAKFPIIGLSFGVERILKFMKLLTPSTFLN